MEHLIGLGFDLVLADPPWRYDFSKSSSKCIERHYPTMPLSAIAELPVAEVAARNAILFLWATAPKIQEALAVMASWGFIYKTNAVWDKQVNGMGYYFRGRHEHLLIGTRGQALTPPVSSRPASVISARRGRHSAKPPILYDILERMYPGLSKLELFARSVRPGWVSWGNQL
jgi:N6-adenosine-specific RNA methylase IME4